MRHECGVAVILIDDKRVLYHADLLTFFRILSSLPSFVSDFVVSGVRFNSASDTACPVLESFYSFSIALASGLC